MVDDVGLTRAGLPLSVALAKRACIVRLFPVWHVLFVTVAESCLSNKVKLSDGGGPGECRDLVVLGQGLDSGNNTNYQLILGTMCVDASSA